MAVADYRLCDLCGNKAFYDSDLDYNFPTPKNPINKEDCVVGTYYTLQHLGDWKVLCNNCSKTHKCVIEKREETGI